MDRLAPSVDLRASDVSRRSTTWRLPIRSLGMHAWMGIGLDVAAVASALGEQRVVLTTLDYHEALAEWRRSVEPGITPVDAASIAGLARIV